MIIASELKAGITIRLEGQLFNVPDVVLGRMA